MICGLFLATDQDNLGPRIWPKLVDFLELRQESFGEKAGNLIASIQIGEIGIKDNDIGFECFKLVNRGKKRGRDAAQITKWLAELLCLP